MTEREIIESAWRLFWESRDAFDSVERHDRKRQFAFMQAMLDWRCADVGHDFMCEQWGDVKRDVCWRCNRTTSSLGYRRSEHEADGTWDGTWEYVPIGPGELPTSGVGDLMTNDRKGRRDDE